MTIKIISPASVTNAVPEVVITLPDNKLLIDLCGEFDKNLAQIEKSIPIQIIRRGNELTLIGNAKSAKSAQDTLEKMYQRLEQNKVLLAADIDAVLRFFHWLIKLGHFVDWRKSISALNWRKV